MRDLGLDGLSEDRRFLIARDPSTDEQFRIPADHRLASLIGKPSHSGNTSGQLEIRMESSLSPRDIQTRIRRGETPQAVADSAGVPVEQILGFAGPVLAEREYMCEQARKTSIRRKHVGGAGVLLGALVAENIAAEGGVPESAAWDSWRREDGRWTVQVTPEGAAHPASFLFDVKSRYVVPADEFAHDLVGDVALPDSTDMAIADAVRTPSRPAEAPVEVQASIVDELEDLLPEPDEEPQVGVASLKEARDRRALEQLAIGEAEEPEDAETTAALEHEVDDFEDSLEHDVAVPDTMGPRKKRHERRRVPSWDEIMFGDKSD
ncbi:septation protein SepH [Aeromicrobium sp. NPDC092404]|uniref:septation protein SepH n=1 Tax=Aeromicrobium sp. NPDC092404 TaxID=3154976 RepID=UPI003440FA97